MKVSCISGRQKREKRGGKREAGGTRRNIKQHLNSRNDSSNHHSFCPHPHTLTPSHSHTLTPASQEDQFMKTWLGLVNERNGLVRKTAELSFQ